MIGIYYIATGSYKVYLDEFIRSIQNFRINNNKKIILLVDDFVDVSYYDIEIEQHIVSDAPWPIITLLKMWYIYKYREDFNEVYYFNANAQVIRDIPNCEDKMLCTRHSCHRNILDGHQFLRIEDDNPKSLSYIGLHDYDYVQAGFFGGKTEIVYKMCEDVSKWVESDLKRGIIPKWHDESYLNKWVFMNKSQCKIIKAWDHINLVRHKNFIPKK